MTERFTIATLQKLQHLMESMLCEVKTGNWDAVAELDEQRRAIIGFNPDHEELLMAPSTSQQPLSTPLKSDEQSPTLPVHQYGPASSSHYKTLRNNLLILDEKINQSARHSRTSLIRENRELQAQVHAKKRYDMTKSAIIQSPG